MSTAEIGLSVLDQRSKHKAIDYVVKVEIGGAAGVMAHLAGKQIPDTHVWVLIGEEFRDI